MNKKHTALFKIVAIYLIFGFIIGMFNNYCAAFFLFGGAIVSFLYEYFGMVK